MLPLAVCTDIFAQLPGLPDVVMPGADFAVLSLTRHLAEHWMSLTVQREHLDRMLGGRNRQLSGRMDSMSSVGSVSERPHSCTHLGPAPAALMHR